MSRQVFQFSRPAMGTTFGLRIVAADAAAARQLARDAFAELEQLERELSRFLPDSDVSRINRLPTGGTLRIGVSAYECLRIAAEVGVQTGGAFDVTAPPGRPVTPGALEVHPDENAVTVRADGVRVDLGGIGKGYAVDAVVELLLRWDVEAALVQGGESTVRAVGLAPEGGPWRAALRNPQSDAEPLGTVALGTRALSGSGSALHGAHIVDPRTGRPAARSAAWAMAPSAARADALSTAFMVMDDAQVSACCAADPQIGAAVPGPGEEAVRYSGRWG